MSKVEFYYRMLFLRGGGSFSDPEWVNTSTRGSVQQAYKSFDIGLRLKLRHVEKTTMEIKFRPKFNGTRGGCYYSCPIRVHYVVRLPKRVSEDGKGMGLRLKLQPTREQDTQEY